MKLHLEKVGGEIKKVIRIAFPLSIVVDVVPPFDMHSTILLTLSLTQSNTFGPTQYNCVSQRIDCS